MVKRIKNLLFGSKQLKKREVIYILKVMKLFLKSMWTKYVFLFSIFLNFLLFPFMLKEEMLMSTKKKWNVSNF